MKQSTIDKCWQEIEEFYQGPPPTADELKAWAIYQTSGKGIVNQYFKHAKALKTWQITQWIEDIATCNAVTFTWEIPPRYGREVFAGVQRKRAKMRLYG